MKGQYRVVTEVMLFAIGVAITGYVIFSFGNVQQSVIELSLRDNMNGVSNIVANGLIKASINENSTIRVQIPDQISRYVYKISVSDDQIVVSTIGKPYISVSKQLFNMSRNYIISGEVVSSAKFIEFVREGNDIMIKRSGR